MQEIAELERRITFALERVSKGLAQLALPSAKDPVIATASNDDQTAALRLELDEERTVTAQLQERLRAIKEKEVLALEALQSQLTSMSGMLAKQNAELGRLRRSLSDTTQELANLTDAGQTGTIEASHINAAMQSELQALRLLRASEAEELGNLVSVLTPLIEEVPAHA
jgi:chromosome segregation ATPase